MGYYSLSYGWSVVVLAACIPALIMCIVILFLDESPRYLSIADNVSVHLSISHPNITSMNSD